eukprot:CAMPEP_0115847890 /NCGR_PEP_ID=MMETSP0287-20121206/10626_1 /TAXON_ID=412157 /ORGANISM="Chrysochromulina rotalis, Strain UIO044" /LENGTH=74 /DNA_ID=CAMNT_0003301759 /DNA_START=681 /DNA_END=905 /DNA_ORIENTATION=+
MSERPNASDPYTDSTTCGQPCTPVALKVTSIGKFHTATLPDSAAVCPDVLIWVMPSSTPRTMRQSSPMAKAYRQ